MKIFDTKKEDETVFRLVNRMFLIIASLLQIKHADHVNVFEHVQLLCCMWL